VQTGGWQVCVPEGMHVWANGPLHVCAAVGQVCDVPLQVWPRGLLHLGAVMPLHTGAMKPLQAPAVPVHSGATAPLQVPTVSPLQTGPEKPLQAPGALLQVWAMALQVCAPALAHVCVWIAPVCGHDGLVGSHQRMFSFS